MPFEKANNEPIIPEIKEIIKKFKNGLLLINSENNKNINLPLKNLMKY